MASVESAQNELEKLKKQQQAIKDKIAKAKAKESKAKRAQDNKRKILAGAWLLDKIEKGEFNKEKFIQGMDAYLSRAADRAVFNLDDSESSQAQEPTKASVPGRDDEQPKEVRGQTWSVEELKAIKMTQVQHPDRTYLLVPRAEKDEAKAQGARFDGSCACWYWEGRMLHNDIVRRWPRP